MWEAIIGLLGNLISAIFPAITAKKEQSKDAEKYREIRFEVARLLTASSRYIYDPVDFSANIPADIKSEYLNVSNSFQNLASEIEAFAETLSPNVKDVPVDAAALHQASRCLWRLSRCFVLPNKCIEQPNYQEYRDLHSDMAAKSEAELRAILNLQIPEKKNGTQNLSEKRNI